jgi:hypothetical protein
VFGLLEERRDAMTADEKRLELFVEELASDMIVFHITAKAISTRVVASRLAMGEEALQDMKSATLAASQRQATEFPDRDGAERSNEMTIVRGGGILARGGGGSGPRDLLEDGAGLSVVVDTDQLGPG